MALEYRAKKHGLCEGEIYYCHFMLENAYYCRQGEERSLVWLFAEDTLLIDSFEAVFSSLYLYLQCRAGRKGRRTEDGRRNFALLPLPNVERCPNKIS